jgi:uncharacterized protein YneF (UPF0154 family)
MSQYFSWEMLWGVGVVLLFVGIAYGYFRSSRRTPKERAVTEEATREMQEHPRRYEEVTRAELQKGAAKASREGHDARRP